VVVKVVWPDEDLDPDDVAGILFFYRTKFSFKIHIYIYFLPQLGDEV